MEVGKNESVDGANSSIHVKLEEPVDEVDAFTIQLQSEHCCEHFEHLHMTRTPGQPTAEVRTPQYSLSLAHSPPPLTLFHTHTNTHETMGT